jgi:hypothetical protein
MSVSGASQGADRVVVSLLAAGISVRDPHQHRIRDAQKRQGPEVGPPHAIENALMGGDRDRREITPRQARLLVTKKSVEDLAARSRPQGRR